MVESPMTDLIRNSADGLTQQSLGHVDEAEYKGQLKSGFRQARVDAASFVSIGRASLGLP